jgi:hypothetical protein
MVFSNLGVQCVKKRDIEEALRTREEIRVDPFRSEKNFVEISKNFSYLIHFQLDTLTVANPHRLTSTLFVFASKCFWKDNKEESSRHQ